MSDYVIQLPDESRQRLDAIRHPKLRALKGVKIGPVQWEYLNDPDHQFGMHGQTRKATKPPFGFNKARKREQERAWAKERNQLRRKFRKAQGES